MLDKEDGARIMGRKQGEECKAYIFFRAVQAIDKLHLESLRDSAYHETKLPPKKRKSVKKEDVAIEG